MRKTTITISFDEEKLTAMRLYMSQKDLKLEGELDRVMEELYTTYVPENVQEFIDMKMCIRDRTGKSFTSILPFTRRKT